MNIDELDRRLLGLLEQDARRTVVSLSEELALSPTAIRRRLDRLKRDGAIHRYTIDISALALGWTIEAFVDVSFGPRTTTAAIFQWLANRPEVSAAWTVTGRADAHLFVRAHDQHHLEQFLNQLREDAGVLHTQTVIGLSRLRPLSP